MEITPNQPFLHGGERYEPGETYDVDDALGGYFVGNGWATAEGLETGLAPASVDLEVDSVVHETKAGEV